MAPGIKVWTDAEGVVRAHCVRASPLRYAVTMLIGVVVGGAFGLVLWSISSNATPPPTPKSMMLLVAGPPIFMACMGVFGVLLTQHMQQLPDVLRFDPRTGVVELPFSKTSIPLQHVRGVALFQIEVVGPHDSQYRFELALEVNNTAGQGEWLPLAQGVWARAAKRLASALGVPLKRVKMAPILMEEYQSLRD